MDHSAALHLELAAGGIELGNDAGELFGEERCALQRAGRGHDHELLRGEPRDKIGRSHILLEAARRLAERTGDAVDFVEADVYDAADVLGRERFDLVYTGIGALCWLPSIRRWAHVVAALLRPGGRLFIREGHPMLWALDDLRTDDLLVVEHPYFERAEPSVWEDGGTYVQTDVTFSHTVTHEWNHGLGEIVTALLDSGMELTALREHDSVPWEALRGRMEQLANREWRIKDRPWRVAHSYTLEAVKRDI